MRFLIIGDLHGKVPKIAYKQYDAIIAPGDFCSDDIKDYAWKALELIKQGKYKSIREIDYADMMGKRKYAAMQQRMFDNGKKVLRSIDKRGKVFAIPGNWDGDNSKGKHSFQKLLAGTKVIDCHRKIVDAGDYSLIGYGIVNGVELLSLRGYKGMPRKEYLKSYANYRRRLAYFDALFRRAKKRGKPIIFLCHTAPYNTAFDLIKQGPAKGMHLGSMVARRMILKHKPLVYIHGHMHEYFGKTKLGSTTVISSGFGPDKNTLLELEGKHIKKISFHSEKRFKQTK